MAEDWTMGCAGNFDHKHGWVPIVWTKGLELCPGQLAVMALLGSGSMAIVPLPLSNQYRVIVQCLSNSIVISTTQSV